MPAYKQLQHKSVFQLHDDLKRSDDGISIGAFTLKSASIPGKVTMISPSGQQTDIDEKVLEDLLKSFF